MNYKTEYKIVTIAFIWIILVFFIFKVNQQEYYFPDEFSYLIASKELYFDFVLNDHRPLLISAIFGFPFLFGANGDMIFLWGIFINLICWLFSIVMIFKIISFFVSKKAAIFYSLFYVFLIGNLFIVFHLLTETIFIFFILSTVFLLIKHQQLKEINLLISAFALLLLSVLIKPIAIVFLFIFMFLYAKSLFFEIMLLKPISALVLVLSFSLILFQCVYMKRVYGIFNISTIDSVTYYNYLGTRADCLEKNIEFVQGKNQRVIAFKKLNHVQQKHVANQDFKHQVSNNTINLTKAFFINLYINSSKGSASVHGLKPNNGNTFYTSSIHLLKGVSKIQNSVLSIFGVFICIFNLRRFKNKTKFQIFISIIIMATILLSAISSDQGDRLHLIIFPLILILMAQFSKPLFAPLQK